MLDIKVKDYIRYLTRTGRIKAGGNLGIALI